MDRLIYDRIAFFARRPIPSALRSSGHKHFVVSPITSIVGKDGQQFVQEVWTEEFKMQPVDVSIKGSTISLFPAFKIEANLKTIRILPALNTVEDEYKKMASKGRDPETCQRTILAKYPSRLAENENFKELSSTGFTPEFRCKRGNTQTYTDQDEKLRQSDKTKDQQATLRAKIQGTSQKNTAPKSNLKRPSKKKAKSARKVDTSSDSDTTTDYTSEQSESSFGSSYEDITYVKTPGSQRSKKHKPRNVSPEPSKNAPSRSTSSDRVEEDNVLSGSPDLFGNGSGEESTVQDSSLGPATNLQRESNESSKPAPNSSPQGDSAALDAIESTVEKFPSDLMSNEALPILKSILTEVKAGKSEVKQQGEILAAFIASEHEFRRQVTSELSEIKELFKIENARQVSEAETFARKHLPIKNDRSMQKVFGDSKTFPGVVSYLNLVVDLSGSATKHPYKKLWGGLFTPGYIATRVLSDTVRGDCTADPMPISPRPLLSYIFTNYVLKRAPFLAETEDEFYKKLGNSTTNARHFNEMDLDKKKDRQEKNKDRINRKRKSDNSVATAHTRSASENEESSPDGAASQSVIQSSQVG